MACSTPRICLVGILVIALIGVAESRQIPKPKSCDASDTWFRHRRSFDYKYEMTLETGFPGTTDVRSGSQLTCDVTVNVPKRCELVIQTSNCELKERGLDGQMELSSKSKKLARLLQKNEVYVQMDRGQVLEGRVVVDKEDPVFITNMQRAIVSQLQLPILPHKQYNQPVMQHDVFGDCSTEVSFDPNTNSILTKRDLLQCSLPQISGWQKTIHSYVKQFDFFIHQKQVDELNNPFEMSVDCQYKIEKARIKRSFCHNKQEFKPITFGGELTTGTIVNVTQSMSLESSSKLHRKKSIVNRQLNGRKMVPIPMELEIAPSKEVTSSDLLEALDATVLGLSKQLLDNVSPQKFQSLVDLARDAGLKTTEEALVSLVACRGKDGCKLPQYPDLMEAKTLQKERESFFTDAMLSCGTEACIATYFHAARQEVMPFLDRELTVWNMGVFYEPAPAAITSLMALCKSSKVTDSCWLTLGTLVRRLSESTRGSQDDAPEAKAALQTVLTQLMDMMGNSCSPGALDSVPPPLRPKKMAPTILALKSLANAGELLDDLKSSVESSVLACVTTPSLPDHLTTAAIRVLNTWKMEKKVLSTLKSVVANSSRQVSHRTLVFDRLRQLDDLDTVRFLVDLIHKEPLANFQLYMVTRLGHMLESNLPQEHGLRMLWRSALKTSPIPKLEEIKGRGSQYMELSRYIELPIANSFSGARMGMWAVYEPSDLVPSRLKLSFSFMLFNRSYPLLDLGADIRGFENIAREMLSQESLFKGGMGATAARLMQALMPSMGEVPTLVFHDKKAMDTLRKLFMKVNMPSGDSAQAQLHLKIFGHEVGYFDVQDIMGLVKGPGMGAKGPQKQASTLATFTQQLSKGWNMFQAKSSKLLEVTRVFPTVAGLPLSVNLQGTMVASTALNAKGDVAKFLGRKGPLEIGGKINATIGVRVTGEETVSIGDMTSSGVRLNVSVLVNGDITGRLKYAPQPENKKSLGAQVLEMALGSPSSQTLLSVKKDLYQLHNGESKAIRTPATQLSVNTCLSDQVQRWLGHSVCAEGFYQNVSIMPHSPHDPFFIMSGPLHLDVKNEVIDKSLKEYKAVYVATGEKRANQPPLMVFIANYSAPGDKLKREFSTLLTVDPASKAVHGQATIPEVDLVYNLDLKSSEDPQGASSHHLMSSVMSVGPDVMHALIFESKDSKTQAELSLPNGDKHSYEVKDMHMKVNLSGPGLSIQAATNTSAGKKPGLFTQGLYIRYFCEPQLGILYLLHGEPKLAAANGHVSHWTLTNEAQISGNSLKEEWTALDLMSVFTPGRNITITNQMRANYSIATRNTTVYWTTGIGTKNITTDIIKTNAEVHNNSVGRHNDISYVMVMSHQDKYEVTVDGSLVGPVSDMDFKMNVAYKTKGKKRVRRSLGGIANRLKQAEEAVVEAVETVEEAVVRRGAQLTDMFLGWLSGDSYYTAQVSRNDTNDTDLTMANTTTTRVFDAPTRADLVKAFAFLQQPQWKIAIDSNIKFKPKPAGLGLDWDVHVNLPDLKKELISCNGTIDRGQRYDVTMDWQLHSDVLNFTLDFFTQQAINLPKVYHWHRWNLVEFTKHRYDRSFSFLIDLERHDHFNYLLNIVSPRTNLTHEINLTSVSPELRTLTVSLDLHNEQPVYDVNYREKTTVTDKGLKTDTELNSTWVDGGMDLDIDWSKQGVLLASAHLDAFGKVSYMQGPRSIDIQLKMDPSKRKEKPSLVVMRNNTEGEVSKMVGTYLAHDLVLFSFSSQKADAKKPTALLDWHIRLAEPTILEHTLSWKPYMTERLFNGVYNFYRSGAHTFMLFGETVADNVYKNITDMVIPFTNMTISAAVDRVTKGQMKRVAMSGLDPKTNVPMSVKITQGALKVLQALQLSWQNSKIGQITYNMGVHKALSTAAWFSTRLHYMVVQDPPFVLRQYLKFHMMPGIRNISASRQFRFTQPPLPFVWYKYLSWPQPRMKSRQLARRGEILGKGGKGKLPFLAIMSRDQIQTFDGITYDITVPKKSKCTYLLGADLSIGNHSMLLSHHSAAMAMREAVVSLSWDGGITINHIKHKYSQLPAEIPNDQASVTLTNGQMQIDLPDHMRMTYDPMSKLYIFEMANHLHNRTLGLLGTTTRESGDDFLLPSGQVMASPVGFQDEYELTGQAKCKSVSPRVSGVGCDENSTVFCTDLLQSPASPLSACFPFVSPEHFLELCLRRTCEILPANPKFACPVVSTYTKLCANRGQEVKVDSEVYDNVCGGCEVTDKSRGKADIVLVPAMPGKAKQSDVNNAMKSLASHAPQNARFALVDNHADHAFAHLFDGELFVEAKKLETTDDPKQSKNETSTPELADLLETAVNYPFRTEARKFIVLFTGDNTWVAGNVSTLQRMLWDRDISLIHVSEDMDKDKVMAATWDGEVRPKCHACDISMAKTETGKLAEETRGMWMSYDTLKKGRKGKIRKMMKSFEHILSQPSPRCAGVILPA